MNRDSKSPSSPLFLVGATATGKSAAALELVRTPGAFEGAAILAMDAMQVYRGADIGTGKPTREEQAETPHGGLDLAEFGASFDVAQYVRHAADFLKEQGERGRRIIVVGGTGLYFRALTQGLCEAPQGTAQRRGELNAWPVEHLRDRLREIDPVMLARVDGANPRRLIRAIEVMEMTGRSLQAWQEETPPPLVPAFTALWLQREKGDLERRMAGRIEGMFRDGWEAEVQGLLGRHGAEMVRSFAGIGYRQIMEGQAAGKGSEAIAREIFVATRQYAKRQLTWFGREPTLQKVMLSGAPSLLATLPLSL